MIVAMFRTYLKPQANLDELGVLHQKMHAIVTNMPGFISVKMFTADDGEVLASLRKFYGTFTTSLAPSAILSSIKASNAVSSTPVTGCASWLGVESIRGKETPWTSTHFSSASPR